MNIAVVRETVLRDLGKGRLSTTVNIPRFISKAKY